MNPEFEEKQFEQPLNEELSVRRRILPVGQVREATVGFDARLFSRNIAFWRLWSHRWRLAPFLPPRRGVPLDDLFWRDAATSIDNISVRLKFNVFVQHKRPEYIKSRLGGEYDRWKQEYFRYEIDPDQQIRPESLENRISKHAIVVYACPAFWKLADLLQYQFKEKLVENTNSAEPHRMHGHQRYAFVEAGKAGEAFSEPSRIPPTNILEMIDTLQEREIPFDTNSGFLNSLAQNILSIREQTQSEFWSLFDETYNSLRVPENEFGRNMLRIGLFVFMTNVSWSIGYETRE